MNLGSEPEQEAGASNELVGDTEMVVSGFRSGLSSTFLSLLCGLALL